MAVLWVFSDFRCDEYCTTVTFYSLAAETLTLSTARVMAGCAVRVPSTGAESPTDCHRAGCSRRQRCGLPSLDTYGSVPERVAPPTPTSPETSARGQPRRSSAGGASTAPGTLPSLQSAGAHPARCG